MKIETKRIAMNEKELIEYTLSLIPKEEKERVFNQEYCGIDSSFIGFIETYYYLSKIIPKKYTVYDFGCGYNPQCYFFQEHEKYIAINPLEKDSQEIFQSPNCEVYRNTAGYFIGSLHKPVQREFAIVNNVPNWHGENVAELVKDYFSNLFTFYIDSDKRII